MLDVHDFKQWGFERIEQYFMHILLCAKAENDVTIRNMVQALNMDQKTSFLEFVGEMDVYWSKEVLDFAKKILLEEL